MKTTWLLSVVPLFTACQHDLLEAGAVELFSEGAASGTIAAPARPESQDTVPSMTCLGRFQEGDPESGQTSHRFVIKNTTDAVYSYTGYAPGSPIYSTERWVDGAWSSSSFGWCGTGLSSHELAPGESLEFSIQGVSISESGELGMQRLRVNLHNTDRVTVELSAELCDEPRMVEACEYR